MSFESSHDAAASEGAVASSPEPTSFSSQNAHDSSTESNHGAVTEPASQHDAETATATAQDVVTAVQTTPPAKRSLADEILQASEATLAGNPVRFDTSDEISTPASSANPEPVVAAESAPAPIAKPAPAADVVAEAADVPVQPDGSAQTKPPVQANATADTALNVVVDDRIRFTDLDLSDAVKEAVISSGYEYPTEIQAAIIPHVLAQRDVLAQSQTGTGKTAAFALPILSRITMHRQPPQVLVLAPTRELAIQVAKSFETYSAHIKGFSVAAIYGGQDYDPQLRQLRRGVQVVVGTPGRVIDHVKRGTLDLSALKCLVLDEADEMLNMGFLEDVQFVLEKTPADRQVALFSATLPEPIRQISKKYLRDPAKITIANKTMTAESIRQRAVFVPPREKIDALRRFIEVEATDGVIVFTKTKDATISVAESLSRDGLSAVALNGDMPQKVRERTISQLKSGKLNILVATDVAARGLDVPRISHVFNFDLPHDTESYIHRIGRTGRAGRDGQAIIFLTNAQRNKLRYIERATKQPIEIVRVPTADDVNQVRITRFNERLTNVIGARDLSLFKDMLVKYADETGQPMEMIAAALAQIGQNGRPFLLKDAPKRPERPSRNERGSHQERGPHDDHASRGERSFRNNRGSSDEREPRRGGRVLGPVADGMTRYRVEVGWRDGVKPGNLVGAIANEAGIDGEYIGPINIENSFATIDLPEGMPGDIYRTLQNTWVSGKKLQLSVAGAGDEARGSFQGGKRPGKFNSGGKPKTHGGKRKFNGGPRSGPGKRGPAKRP